MCHEKAGRDDLAVKDYSAHLELEPRSQYGLELRGALYFRARQYDRALADFAQALVVNPSSPTALYGRGMVKQKTGDARGGEEDVETAKAHAQPRGRADGRARGEMAGELTATLPATS